MNMTAETLNDLKGAQTAVNMFTEALKAFTKIEEEKTEILKSIATNVAALSGRKPAAKRKKELVHRPEKKRIHRSIYYAYAGETDVYEAKNMKEFAEMHDIPFTFGWLDPNHKNIRNEEQRLIEEAVTAFRLLDKNGTRLALFGYYMTPDFPAVPHCVIFRNDAKKEIFTWCEEYAKCVEQFTEYPASDEDAAKIPETPAPEPVGNSDADLMDEILKTCVKCVHRQKETKNTLISCSRHFYTIPKYHTKSHERKYLANVKSKNEIDFPNCFKPEGGEPCTAEN